MAIAALTYGVLAWLFKDWRPRWRRELNRIAEQWFVQLAARGVLKSEEVHAV